MLRTQRYSRLAEVSLTITDHCSVSRVTSTPALPPETGCQSAGVVHCAWASASITSSSQSRTQGTEGAGIVTNSLELRELVLNRAEHAAHGGSVGEPGQHLRREVRREVRR